MKKQLSLIIPLMLALGTTKSTVAQDYLKHTVQPYETIYSIPVHYNITTNDFLAINHFDAHIRLLPGSEVLIRELTPADMELAYNKHEELKEKKLSRHEIALAEERAKIDAAPITKLEPTKPKESLAVVVKNAVPPVVSAKTTEANASLPEDIGPNGIRYKISKTGYHLVESKQTLFHLALIYNQTVEHLKQINSLPTTDISVGQKLKVSN